MNLASAIVIAAVCVLAGIAVRHGLRRTKGCACGCAGCGKVCRNGK
ncbi:MAG: FeoB-associated Cys-rich membrane protein [Kiritimatiellia bacterium]